MVHAEILELALTLSEPEKIRLDEKLLETLGPETDGAEDESLSHEVQRRSLEIPGGTVRTRVSRLATSGNNS